MSSRHILSIVALSITTAFIFSPAKAQAVASNRATPTGILIDPYQLNSSSAGKRLRASSSRSMPRAKSRAVAYGINGMTARSASLHSSADEMLSDGHAGGEISYGC
jgi:hypothetical protein